MICERCGTDNPEGVVVCLQCYFAVGVPYGGGKGSKKAGGKVPAWATQMGLSDAEARQAASLLGNAANGQVLAFWFAKREDASDTQKALADTIGKEIQSKKVKVGVVSAQGRTALFVAGKVGDAPGVQATCEAFGGQSALG